MDRGGGGGIRGEGIIEGREGLKGGVCYVLIEKRGVDRGVDRGGGKGCNRGGLIEHRGVTKW